ncbi:nucleosome-remodeling factor subunit NURF301 isoform X2 [Neocloeon triangulifer]|uniref:nucleosome-remodeling factor subunit NURF301 isoform X2 n=1 Tax=Neocloeon triangulifer TaxID=2078957 RepID=UPI00286ECD85|nr:nucleosome-remodeling factor subunit NURF301 isoform X2 [Neocloeon triangulifer]
MSSRGGKKRGRPPKAVSLERPKSSSKVVKKPKYLLGSETPSSSRASSPGSSLGRRSSKRTAASRPSVTNSTPSSSKRGGANQRGKSRYGYQEFHYGSDFEDDDSASNKSDLEDDLDSPESEDESIVDEESVHEVSDEEFSLTSERPKASQRPSPIPIWLQDDKECPPLELPASSDDLMVPREYVMKVLSVYEVVRHFGSLVRLSPFRFEDLCASLVSEEQSALLAEVHMALLKALLREEDAQQTHFGPLDHRDSVNILLYLIDPLTWPEALKAYVESDKEFVAYGRVQQIVSHEDYPFVDIADRLEVLQFLTDQFLTINPVREDLLSEGNISYDDHCRICHRVGKLLCCETCPAVFHLECIEPALQEVPNNDWQCALCKANQVTGVSDCSSALEKSNILYRQEHLGYDRHGRKYWFLARRIFVENEEGEIWYYSTKVQLDALLDALDDEDMESMLCRELSDCHDEIVRQMEITEKVTISQKGNKKSYLDSENAAIIKAQKDKEEKEAKELEAAKAREEGLDVDEAPEAVVQEEVVTEEVETANAKDVAATPAVTPAKDKEPGKEGSDHESEKEEEETEVKDKDGKHVIVTRSKTGSLTPRTFNMEDLRRRAAATESGGSEGLRMTRLKAHQIASGTYLFKLGMEGGFKNYVNHYSVIPGALTRAQRNEERDKKRHLSHKFSLTQASEFKWAGPVNGTRALLINTLRQTMLQVETNMQTAFMHTNWPLLKKQWVASVTASINPKDFAKALIILQACMKPVVFATVWHESLGHTKLQRLTAAEREDRKKLEKREKKEKDEEEERNRLNYSLVKYTLGLKHQVYKQRGEEYRIHGQWGWMWLNQARKFKAESCAGMGLKGTPQKLMVQVKEDRVTKIIAVDLPVYNKLIDRSDLLTVSDSQIPKPEGYVPSSTRLKERAEASRLKTPVKEEEEVNVTDSPEKQPEAKPGKADEQKDEPVKEETEIKEEKMEVDDAKEEGESVPKKDDTEKVKEESSVSNDSEKMEKSEEIKNDSELIKEESPEVEETAKNCTEDKVEKMEVDVKEEKMDEPEKVVEEVAKPVENEVKAEQEDKSETPKSESKTEQKAPETPKEASSTSGHRLLVFRPVCEFDEIDISRALTMPGRLAYPKVAKPSKLDEFLHRRLQLKAVEERTLALTAENKMSPQKQPTASPAQANSSSATTQVVQPPKHTREELEAMSKEVAYHLELYSSAHKLSKDHPCYNPLCKPNSSVPNCYSPMCIQRYRLRKELLMTLCKAKSMGIDINSKIGAQASVHSKAPTTKKTESDVKQEETKPEDKQEPILPASPEKVAEKVEVKQETKQEVKQEETLSSELTVEKKDETTVQVTTTTTTVTTTTVTESVTTKVTASDSGVLKAALSKSRQHMSRPQPEPVDKQRVYSADNPSGKLYLKKLVRATTTTTTTTTSTLSTVLAGGRRKKIQVKYPLSSKYCSFSKKNTILALPQHELRKMSRKGGYTYAYGFSHTAKANQTVWPYPCPRPLFKTCWMYRMTLATSLATVAMQLRIFWHCMRWDDMQTKPPNSDGKNQVTTDTEITSTELLKHRHVGQFMEKTQYLRRKVVIPIDLPKSVREVTSMRVGLRKRKREEAPQNTEPKVIEDWIDEEKLELWEIKQYNDRLTRANNLVVTRSRTGSSAPTKPSDQPATPTTGTKQEVAKVQSAEEIKQQLEQNLKLQRAALQQKRALDGVSPKPNILKMVPSPAQAAAKQGAGQKATVTTRVFVTKDGASRMIGQQANILPKAVVAPGQPQQSLIRLTPGTANATPTTPTQQKVQIIPGPDGKYQVRGLLPGQQLVQLPGGKIQVMYTSPTVSSTVTTPTILKTVTVQAPGTPLSSKTALAAGPRVTTVVTQPTTVVQTVSQPTQITQTAIQPTTSGTPVTSTPGPTVKVVTAPSSVGKTNLLAQQLMASPTAAGTTTPRQLVIRQGTPGGTPTVQKIVSAGGNQVIVSNAQVFTTPSGQQVLLQSAGGTPGNQQFVIGGRIINGQQVLIRGPNNTLMTLAGTPAQGNMIVKTVSATPGGQKIVQKPIIVQKPALAPTTVVAASSPSVPSNITTPTASTTTTPTTQTPVVIAAQPATPQTPSTPSKETTPKPQPTPQTTVVVAAPSSTTPAAQPGAPLPKLLGNPTAQVIQTPNGPSIILQGLRGNFTEQQLASLKEQVKQHVLKQQANKLSGNQMVISMPPANPVQQVVATSQPVAVSATPVTPQTIVKTVMAPVQAVTPLVAKPAEQPKVVVQTVQPVKPEVKVVVKAEQQPPMQQVARQVLVNGQSSAQPEAPKSPPGKNDKGQFVVTPDYIQQTIKSALKQDNLPPEIEEKLLQMQRYQERQMKGPVVQQTPPPATPPSRSSQSRKRNASTTVPATPAVEGATPKDPNWEPARKRSANRGGAAAAAAPDLPKEAKEEKPTPSSSTPTGGRNRKSWKEQQEEKKQAQAAQQLNNLLFRTTEALRKEATKKRAFLEKELIAEIQREVAVELAARTLAERNKQEEVRTTKRKVSGSGPQPRQVAVAGGQHGAPSTVPKTPPKKRQKRSSSPSGRNKKEKLFCSCRTPYDDTKFYVGCDLCNNWFHGDCVGITEQQSKGMTEFVCDECKHARDTKELYCLCKQPYDESKFYICCDQCQNWFHGRCVGILQSEADGIDEYVCPNCQGSSEINQANMRNLNARDNELLKKLIKQIQTHKSSWPFMEPVDPTEAPNYYKVINEPMDLQTIELRVNEKAYQKLRDFIGDMTKIFDNCRFYNPKESPFYRCAENLEAFFVQKLKMLRAKMLETN